MPRQGRRSPLRDATGWGPHHGQVGCAALHREDTHLVLEVRCASRAWRARRRGSSCRQQRCASALLDPGCVRCFCTCSLRSSKTVTQDTGGQGIWETTGQVQTKWASFSASHASAYLRTRRCSLQARSWHRSSHVAQQACCCCCCSRGAGIRRPPQQYICTQNQATSARSVPAQHRRKVRRPSHTCVSGTQGCVRAQVRALATTLQGDVQPCSSNRHAHPSPSTPSAPLAGRSPEKAAMSWPCLRRRSSAHDRTPTPPAERCPSPAARHMPRY